MFLGYIDPGTGFTISSSGAWVIAALLGFIGLFSLLLKRIFHFLKNNKKMFIILLLLVIITVALTITIIMNKRRSPFNNKIIILAFDGLSPKIMEPMMKDGKLPHFSQLMAEGSYGHLSTTNPAQSPVAWAGFATGRNSGKNNIFDFIVRDPKNYGLSLSLSNIKNGRPIRVIK